MRNGVVLAQIPQKLALQLICWVTGKRKPTLGFTAFGVAQRNVAAHSLCLTAGQLECDFALGGIEFNNPEAVYSRCRGGAVIKKAPDVSNQNRSGIVVRGAPRLLDV